MARAVKLDGYGGLDVLHLVDEPQPAAIPGRVVVRVVAAAINPGEASIRKGLLKDVWPSTFPSGQGSDFAGRVEAIGPGVTSFAVGDEVLGFSDERAAHADYVSVPVDQLVAKPASVPFDVASTLHVAGCTAFASIRAVGPVAGETIVVSAAAGGVGSITVQLARHTGARVIGIAGSSNADYLRSLGVEPVEHGDGLEQRLRDMTPAGIDAFVDNFGSGYVDLAIALGVEPTRINTVIDWPAAKEHGTQAVGGATASTAEVLAELAGLVADGRLTVEVAATYPLEQVREAFAELEQRHTRGKIVLLT